MNKILNRLVLAVLLVMSMPTAVVAQTSSDEPIITFKTNIYESVGDTNQFSLVLGTVDAGQYIDVDCGFGKIEYETVQSAYNEDTQEIGGTFIECQVSKEGIVKIYGDAAQMDYLNASGCYIEWIEFAEGVKFDILDLSHNELKRLDLTNQSQLRALYVSDNAFTAETPLIIGGNKPELYILEVSIIEHMDSDFNLSDYPKMMSFDGYHNVSLTKIDPTGCPNLQRLTLDVTNVASVDVSQNPNLAILNVSDTKVTSLDVSKNPNLQQLYCSHRGSYNNEYKISELDVTNNPYLIYLFCAGNKLTELDLSKNTYLQFLSVTDNYLTKIDLSNCPNLYQVYLNDNCMDFATLPVNPGTWNTYYYGQRSFDVDKSYKVGAVFDYSDRVLREGTTTGAAVYAVSEYNPAAPELLDESYYTYVDGKVTILKEHADSIYIAFANSELNEYVLTTEKFMVKSEAEFGKATKVFNFTTSVSPGGQIAFGIGAEGATPENPVEFLVDFGDQTQVAFTATSSDAPTVANVTGTKAGYGAIAVYAPEGVTLTAVDVKDIPMYSADVTKLVSMRTLRLANAGLYTVDLSWNRCLQTLDLSGNNLSNLTLEGNNSSYSKNALTNINLSNNKLTDVTLNDMRAIRILNLSNNQLSKAISFYNGDYVEEVNFSHNAFTELDFTYCYALKRLDISDNQLPAVTMPEESVLEYFDCRGNLFTLATLPAHGNLSEDNYVYAPQADFIIATKGPGVDLSELNLDGATQYTWRNEAGDALVEGTDYTNNNGLMKFLNVEVGNIVCEMTNPAFPEFTGENVYKTTPILAAGMPTNVVATFKTVNEGDTVALSLAAVKAGTAVYFDWAGDGNMTQYLLSDTYRRFNAITKAGTVVNVYTYEPAETISVFSMGGAVLESFDGSKLVDAINISVTGAGLSEIKLPEGSAKLSELSLENNNLTSFDLSKYPALNLVALSGNKLTSLDLSKNANIGQLSAANNLLTEVKLDNEKLWALYLDQNKLTEINLEKAANISQLTLSENELSSIDVEPLTKLIWLTINNNKFTFKTLPLAKSTYVAYSYHGQAPIDAVAVDGVVDLADQALVDGTETVYRWFVGTPSVNSDTGELEGEELYIDEEYTLDGGVTTFLKSFNNIMCVMTNTKLPNVYIFTNLMDVVGSGIDAVGADSDIAVTVNGHNVVVETQEAGLPVALVALNGAVVHRTETAEGRTVISDVDPGVYVVVVGGKAAKILVK
ncbi:MAG: hypothetical protein IJ328_06910 [Muribaculaceae bacterium]|nr:hypothetical protein [Muribaculaceae bacterium]